MTTTTASAASPTIPAAAGVSVGPGDAGSHLPADLLEAYRRDGYVVLRQALSPRDVQALREGLLALVRGEYGPLRGSSVTPEMDDDAALRATLCVHFPHKRAQLFADALRHPLVVAALTSLLGPDVKSMQSMAFVKSEGKPGQAWHQDEQFIPTRDRSLTAAWIALDDATVRNGCLWALPGSHRRGVLYPQRLQDDARFDCSREAHEFPYSDDQAVPLEVAAGDVVLFDGHLLHRSLPNTGEHGMRRALVNHYMSASSLLPWEPSAEAIAMTDYRDVVIVAGEDPYAWAGYEDRSVVEVRPDKEGGCR